MAPQIKLLISVLFIFASLFQEVAHSQETPRTAAIIRVHVTREDHQPVSHTLVVLAGKSRENLHSYFDSLSYPAWNALTDEAGNCEFKLVATSDDERIQPPAQGLYLVIARRTKADAGGISKEIKLPATATSETTASTTQSITSAARVPIIPVNLVIRIGTTLEGDVEGNDGRPAANLWLEGVQGFEMESEDGRGGVYSSISATTDKTGHFIFEHVLNEPLRIEVPGMPSDVIMTGYRDAKNAPWNTGMISEIVPRLDQPNYVGLKIAMDPMYAVHGRVVDKAGKPVAKAEVSAGVSWHEVEESYADTHHFEHGRTAADGTFRIPIRTPYVRFVHAFTADLFGESEFREQSPYLGPGDINLILHPKTADEARSFPATPLER